MNRIQKIKEEYNEKSGKLISEYRDLLKNEYETQLNELGMLDTDVIMLRNGKKGRVRLKLNNYSNMDYEICFYPYKKDGTLSETYNNVFVNYWNFTANMREKFKIAEEIKGT